MRSRLIVALFALCLVPFAAGATEISPGPVSGDWDEAGNPYNINGEITVPTGECLTIGEGVEVIFQGHHKLIVNGCLETAGTELSPILFSAANTLDGWHGIRFIGASDSSHLTHCIIEYGRGEGAHIDDRDGWAGGVLCDSCSPSIRNCTFRENSTNWIGGGIMCYSSSSVISHCRFTGNSAYYGGAGYGYLANPTFSHCDILKNTGVDQSGGLQFEVCTTIVENCTISGNSAGSWGGGIGGVTSGQLTVQDCTVSDNSSGYIGGGIAGYQVEMTITGNVIRGNSALNQYGGGIYAYGSTGTICNNVISDNNGQSAGGGIMLWLVNLYELRNNLIYQNSTAGYGGGIRCYQNCTATLVNTTLYGNSADQYGGGISCESGSSVTAANTIFWDNSAGIEADEIFIGYTSNPSTINITYSDVRGGQFDHVVVQPGCTLNWGFGMIEDDPQFFDPGSDPGSDNYRLRQDPCQPGVVNPCVDGGNPLSPIEWTTRTDCHPDVDVVDMGYHYPFPETVTADLTCVPDAGILPFASQFGVTLGNTVQYDRTVAGRIDVNLAGGANFASWRAGYTNLGPGETFTASWPQTLPALSGLAGANLFELHAEGRDTATVQPATLFPVGCNSHRRLHGDWCAAVIGN